MALPFVLGLAVGAGAVVAFNKSDKLKETACSIFKKSKDIASESLEKGKETVGDVKNTIDATAQCIKEKKAQVVEEKKTQIASEKVEKTIEEK